MCENLFFGTKTVFSFGIRTREEVEVEVEVERNGRKRRERKKKGGGIARRVLEFEVLFKEEMLLSVITTATTEHIKTFFLEFVSLPLS